MLITFFVVLLGYTETRPNGYVCKHGYEPFAKIQSTSVRRVIIYPTIMPILFGHIINPSTL